MTRPGALTDLLLLAIAASTLSLVCCETTEADDVVVHLNRRERKLWPVDLIENVNRTFSDHPGSSFIVGGSDGQIMNYAHQAALLIKRSGYFYQICGGSLFRRDIVITAAHCAKDDGSETYYVVMGMSDLSNGNDPNMQFVEVEKVTRHEDYVDGELYNDIALLKLKSHLKRTPFVKTIKLGVGLDGLPKYNKWNILRKPCEVSGFGQNGKDSKNYVIQSAKFDIVSSLSCALKWREIAGRTIKIKLSQLCIKHKDSSPCFGDSGGPLTCNGRLTGLVSWGHSGCKTNTPAVFTRLQAYRLWILKHIFLK